MTSAPQAATVGQDASLGVELAGLRLRNPVMPASGCFGPELGEVIDTTRLGATVTKTVFSAVRSGNPEHRVTETIGGMINAVGIPSPGMARFREQIAPAYLALGAPLIISIGGLAVEEYFEVAEQVADCGHTALEVNVSCPNLEHGGLEIGSNPDDIGRVVAGVVARSQRPVFVKLTPNVTDIAALAVAAEQAGAAGVTVANTVVGLVLDAPSRTAVLGNTTGGVSGPGIKALALRWVYQVAGRVSIPVIGCGGITSARDVAEFLIAGASAVQVGTATFTRPDAMLRIIDELPAELSRLGVRTPTELVGSLRRPTP